MFKLAYSFSFSSLLIPKNFRNFFHDNLPLRAYWEIINVHLPYLDSYHNQSRVISYDYYQEDSIATSNWIFNFVKIWVYTRNVESWQCEQNIISILIESPVDALDLEFLLVIDSKKKKRERKKECCRLIESIFHLRCIRQTDEAETQLRLSVSILFLSNGFLVVST